MKFEWKIISRGPSDIAELSAQKCVEDETNRSTQSHQDRAFGDKLANDMAAAGAERFANRQLTLPGNTARQQQACHIQAGDQPQDRRSAKQHYEKHEETAVVAFAGSGGGQTGHGPEYGGTTRELLAPDVASDRE